MDQPPDANSQEQIKNLVQRAQAGDEKAYTDLFIQYKASIYRYIEFQVRDQDQAEDLLQNTFLNAWRGIAQFRGEANFRTWLFRIATNVIFMYRREQRHWPEAIPLSAVYERATPIRFEERIEQRELIIAALQKVREKERACLLLKHVANFSRQEIAEIVGISVDSVSSYISLARYNFREAYNRLQRQSNPAYHEGGTHHGR